MLLIKNFFDITFFKRIITGSIFLIVFWSIFFIKPIYFSFFITSILGIIIFFEWPKLFKTNSLPFWVIMPFYPILPFLLIILLNTEQYRILLLVLFVLVFCFDSGSYVFGKLYGKNKLCHKVSPGKTLEGFIGGFFSVLIALATILLILKKKIIFLDIFMICMIVSLLALFGDLFESFLKRRANIKDSGNFLPGHGGFLDRFDGIMFVVFYFYFFRDYILTFFI